MIHYAFIETLRQAEFVALDESTYKQAAAEVAKQYGSTIDAPSVDVKGFQDEVNHKIKAMGGSKEVSLGKPEMLGTIFSKPDATSFGMLMDVAYTGKTAKVVIGSTLLKVQDRLLYEVVFALYTGDDSLAWVRTTSEQWADAILKANLQK